MIRVLVLSLLFLLSFSSFAGEKDILIIHSYSTDMEWVVNQTKGIKNILGDQYNFHQFYLDTKKIPEKLFKTRAEKAMEMFQRIKPAIVFTTDDNALRLVGKRIIKRTPLVFSGINGDLRLDYPWVFQSKNVSGVLERQLIKRSILEIKKMLNIQGKVLYLLGDSATAKAYYQNEFLLDAPNHTPEDVFMSGDFDKWKDVIRSSKSNGYSMMMIAGNQGMKKFGGSYLHPDEMNEWIFKHSPIPAFSNLSPHISKNHLIGGVLNNGVAMGEKAGKIALKMLSKDRPENAGSLIISQQYQQMIFKFSRSGLKKWNLVPSALDKRNIIWVD